MSEEMTIRAIAPWFGGKRTLAMDIIAELGKHSQYFGPFMGGMAVVLRKEPCQKETVCDLHGDITNLARVIQRADEAEDLYDRLQRVVISEGLLQDAGQYLEAPYARDRDEVEWAYWYFVASWMQRNGVAGTDRCGYQIAVRWSKGGGSPVVRFRNAVESLPWWHQRLLNVVILHRDAFRFLHKFEDCLGTAIYVDPPYAAEVRTGFDSHSGEHSRYRHEFDHVGEAENLFGRKRKIDTHERLRDILAGYKKARIVVSYYDCPRVRELYAGWTFIDKTMNKNLTQANGTNEPREAPEVLIINGPSFVETA